MTHLIRRILEKVGLIPTFQLKNQPCYDKYGRFIGWFSRSVASTIFVFCKDENGEWCVLASERGKEAADYQGYWNCPCGYVDFGETTKITALRELAEETGVKLPISTPIEFMNYEDDPIKANRQNITFRFRVVIEDKTTKDFVFSHAENEGMEVGEIKWLKLDEVFNYQWAFNHDKLIKEFFPH